MENVRDIIPGIIEMITKERAHLEWLQKKMPKVGNRLSGQLIRAFIRRSSRMLAHLEERLNQYCEYCGYHVEEMLPGTVDHGEWFEMQTDMGIIRARYLSAGYTYATMEVQRLVRHERRKYWLFGPCMEISKWVCVTTNSRLEFYKETPVIKRMTSYSTEQTRMLAVDIFISSLKKKK